MVGREDEEGEGDLYLLFHLDDLPPQNEINFVSEGMDGFVVAESPSINPRNRGRKKDIRKEGRKEGRREKGEGRREKERKGRQGARRLPDFPIRPITFSNGSLSIFCSCSFSFSLLTLIRFSSFVCFPFFSYSILSRSKFIRNFSEIPFSPLNTLKHFSKCSLYFLLPPFPFLFRFFSFAFTP